MSAVPIEPRPLNAAERAVLEHLLEADFAGAPQLRGQLDHTQVVATWGTGSVSVDLRVLGPEQHPAAPSTLLPTGAGVYDHSGQYIGELLLWAEGGTTLSALEYAWVTDEMPTCLPPLDRIQRTAG
ncbi:hypothetical protein P3T36_007182 [Kitasatospora sp. MAP12-15]|uniref:hypothetical protein n=1 Tax=unclassified Kitasatospora TaxID=2633591 RepID=UPI0024742286|nr:hypothetical protein [Kitasatospora sp. MAP12-44]MDH6115346.1 hypothetical protein [Kitasatospora sp. MAP12-44]